MVGGYGKGEAVMHFEFERRRELSEEQKRVIADEIADDIVNVGYYRRQTTYMDREIYTADMEEDTSFVERQIGLQKIEELPCQIVEMKSNRPNAIWWSLVGFDELTNVRGAFDKSIQILARSGLRWMLVPQDDGKDVYIEGMRKFVRERVNSVYSGLDGGQLHRVEVSSNRIGDVILCAKGHFLSTRKSIGVSTPAVNDLHAGTYSFGINERSGPKFDGVLWDVPSRSPIKVDLP